jgi:hypothetical protein
MEARETRQAAYAQLVRNIEGYHPRYIQTQHGLAESERLQLKIKLFVEHHLRKVLEKEAWHGNALERRDAAVQSQKCHRSVGNPG